MDPCQFVRLTVTSLSIKTPTAKKPARSAVHPTTSPCFCRIKLKSFPTQTSPVPESPDTSPGSYFHLSKLVNNKRLCLKITVLAGRVGSTCGLGSGRVLGKVKVPLDITDSKANKGVVVYYNGWVELGNKEGGKFYVCVRSEPDRRFVFRFEREPECSPLVFQVRGDVSQPVFTCKFSFRSSDRTRSLSSEPNSSRKWLSSFGSERERPGKERKGWSVTVHDLSGSPVAAASMVTPFVASPGSDRVSRSNPGSWLILRPSDGTWKPWGRLEAWRERGSSDGLGFRFELIPENSASGVVLVESTISSSKGGKFFIDLGSAPLPANGRTTPGGATSPASSSPRGSGDYGHGLWPYCMYRGFVMSATVEGEGSKCSKPTVEVSVNHVGCAEDAAAFVALSAAIDLSMDACRLFSQKLRKELCPSQDLLT